MIIKKPIRLLELFGGIGACSAAFKRLGIPYVIADYVEIDKYAVKSYNAMHGTHFEPQDITQWDKEIEVDFIMHGSPCQDFSIAGRGAGGDKGSGTRSSLMYETIRIVEKLKPKYVLWENVPNMLSDKHRHNFDAYWETMETLGYVNQSWKLNAKDYGIPQNRTRIYTLSIRSDIPEAKHFFYPKRKALEGYFLDFLEIGVDSKYNVSPGILNAFLKNHPKYPRKDRFFQNLNRSNQQIANAITTRSGGRESDNFIKLRNFKYSFIPMTEKDIRTVIRLFGMFDTPSQKRQAGSVFETFGMCPTLDTMQGGYHQPCILEGPIKDGEILQIRRLTPKECWRLMGFTDQQFTQAACVNSDTQLYKQAGNSIVVHVLVSILEGLFYPENQTKNIFF